MNSSLTRNPFSGPQFDTATDITEATHNWLSISVARRSALASKGLSNSGLSRNSLTTWIRYRPSEIHRSSIGRTACCWLLAVRPMRSEEHTSELQSLTNLVCRLLLEKKKQTK